MSVRLSPRLQAIASLVPSGARLIDVGTDHGLLPVWLALSGRIRHAWASDLRPGPLQGAAKLIREEGVEEIVFPRLTDGLEGYSPSDGDTIVIAGMGGETIVSILSACEWAKSGCLIIMAPHTKQDVLRRYLLENNYSITAEKLAEDAGRIYPLLAAVGGGEPGSYSEGELYTGSYDMLAEDPLFARYLDQLIHRGEKAAPYDADAASLLAEYKSMQERLESYGKSI